MPTAAADSPAIDRPLPTAERLAWSGVVLAGLILRLIYVGRYRFDSDEPQHLHVVWGWTQGQLPYRDFFDNHTPLFHLLCAPLLRAIGERADVLVWMRLALLPGYFFSLWCVYRLGLLVFARRTALWAAVLAGLYPYYFFPSLEFRTDNLWGPVWLLLLVVLLTGRMSAPRCFGAGLLLGICFCISLKTVLMAMALACAALLLHLAAPGLRTAAGWRRLAGAAAAGLAGAALPPAVLCAWFASHGALRALYECAVLHNLTKADTHSRGFNFWIIVALAALPLLGWHAARTTTSNSRPGLQARQSFLIMLTSFYVLLLLSIWRELTRQDFIPFNPLFLLLLTPLLLAGGEALLARHAGRAPALRAAVPLALSLTGLLWVFLGRSVFVQGARGQIRFVAEVLRLTKPGDFVMDFKGESIFRRRPTRLVFEPVTRDRLKAGTMQDDVAAGLVAHEVHVALSATRRLPHAAEDFIQANYLRVGQASVAGQWLRTAGTRYDFTIAIPGTYTLISAAGITSGMLDGSLCDGPVALTPGSHTFAPRNDAPRLAVLWAPAVALGFSPFDPPPFERFESEF